jgi:hypothetical protein
MLKEKAEHLFKLNGLEVVGWNWNRQWNPKRRTQVNGFPNKTAKQVMGVIVGARVRHSSGKVITVCTFGAASKVREKLAIKLALITLQS